MQTGALILRNLSERLEELGHDYYETNIANLDEVQVHLVDLDRSIYRFRTQPATIEALQDIIIRSARLIEAYQVKIAEVEAEKQQTEREEVIEEKPKSSSRKKTTTK